MACPCNGLGGGGGHHGGHHGGRRFGGGGRRFGGGGYAYPWYDYGPGPLVLVEDDEEERQRIALLAAQLAAQQVAAQAKKTGGTKGVGIFGQRPKMAHPLSEGVQGLGAVPSQCWDIAGFKDCHNQQFVKAQLFCNSQTAQWLEDRGYTSVDACIKQTDSAYTQENCVSKYCPPGGTTAPTTTATTTGGEYPWGAYSAATLALQQQTNKALKEAGYCLIGTDGKLGPGTCGAIKKLLGATMAPSTCQKFTDPSKPPCTTAVSYKAPAALPGVPGAPSTMTASMYPGGGTDWKKYAAFAAGALVIGGLAYYMTTRKQKAA